MVRLTGTNNPHWEWFAAFCQGELESGGPDPQVLLTARALDGVTRDTAARRAGSFVNPYTCGAAAAFWHWDDTGVSITPDLLREHWAGLPTRRERRSVWNVDKMVVAHDAWAHWVSHELPRVCDLAYSEVYDSIQDTVPYFGRYAAMKVIEVLYQSRIVTHGQSDIRSRGAKFPRRTLALLHPDSATMLRDGGDGASTLAAVDGLATATREWLATRLGRQPTWFQFETLLCNYRQSLAGKYPGRSHDRELAHWRTAEAYWGADLLEVFPFYALRHRLFDAEWLGELGDPPWYSAREQLEIAWKERYVAD